MKRSSNKAKQEIKKTEIIKQTKNNAKKEYGPLRPSQISTQLINDDSAGRKLVKI